MRIRSSNLSLALFASSLFACAVNCSGSVDTSSAPTNDEGDVNDPSSDPVDPGDSDMVPRAGVYEFTQSPVTDECWWEAKSECDVEGLGGSGGASCAVSDEIEVTCSVLNFWSLPQIGPDQDGVLQFAGQGMFRINGSEQSEYFYASLSEDGTIDLREISTDTEHGWQSLTVLGLAPDRSGFPIYYDEAETGLSISAPFAPKEGKQGPAWRQVTDGAEFASAIAQAPDGTIHLIANERFEDNAPTFYAHGTSSDGFTVAGNPWPAVPSQFAFTSESEPIGLWLNDERVLAAERGGQARTVANVAPSHEYWLTGQAQGDTGEEFFIVSVNSDANLRAYPGSGALPGGVEIPVTGKWGGDCESDPCDGSCEYEGEWLAGQAAVISSEGRAFVAVHTVHEDTRTEGYVVTSDDAYICGSHYSRDESTSNIAIYEVDFDAETVNLVLELDVPGLAPVPLNRPFYTRNYVELGAFDDELWLSFPVLNTDMTRHSFRTLRLNTADL